MWLGGLFVWFTDSGNSLLVGPIFQPIAERFRVSREKVRLHLRCDLLSYLRPRAGHQLGRLYHGAD